MSGQELRDGAIIDPSASRRLPSPEGKPTVTVLDYGKIIAQELRGRDLENKLKEVLN